jgi:hypothetical protein
VSQAASVPSRLAATATLLAAPAAHTSNRSVVSSRAVTGGDNCSAVSPNVTKSVILRQWYAERLSSWDRFPR